MSGFVGKVPVGFRGVRQTIFAGPEGDPVGNCLQAAVASMMGRELDEVPHFCQIGGDDWGWWIELRNWFRGMDLDIYPVAPEDLGRLELQVPCLATGRSPRGVWNHTVVADHEGNIIWDPYPSDEGVESIIEYDVVTNAPYDPAPEEQVREWLSIR